MDNKNLTPDLAGEAFYSWNEEDLHNIIRHEDRASPAENEQLENIYNRSRDVLPTEIDLYNKALNGAENSLTSRNSTPNYLLGDEGNEDPMFSQRRVDPRAQELQRQQQLNQQEEQHRQQSPIGEDVYSTAFDLLKDFGLIEGNIEVKDQNSLLQLRDMTMQRNYETAVQTIRENASRDPYMLQLIDYSLQGGVYADIPKMREFIDQEINIQSIDITQPAIQEAVVRDYLLATGTQDKYVDVVVDKLKQDNMLSTEANTAKNYFVALTQKSQQEEMMRTVEKQRISQMQEMEHRKYEQQWNNAFVDSLNKRNWSEQKKREVLSQYDELRLQDGNTIPIYQYKEEIIRNNPMLFQNYLDFLASFDLKTGIFRNSQPEKTAEKIAAQRLINNLSRKQQGTTGTGRPMSQQQPRGFTANPYETI